MDHHRHKFEPENLPTSPSANCSSKQVSQRLWPSFLQRGILFTLLWWILAEGDNESWWIGLPAVLLATAVSVALIAPVCLVWHELFRFVPYFVMRSLLGGIDVAWRAVHPRLPISPFLLEYPLRLPPGLPSVFMANAVSLLPGTLSTELGPRRLQVHVLNGKKDVLPQLEKLENMVAALFDERLPPRPGGTD